MQILFNKSLQIPIQRQTEEPQMVFNINECVCFVWGGGKNVKVTNTIFFERKKLLNPALIYNLYDQKLLNNFTNQVS
jgi:hypothetical protein